VSRQRRKEGDIVVSANGYSYTYVMRGEKLERVLTHWIVGEKKYGRPPGDDERVIFKDNNRANLKAENIEYVKKGDPVSALKKRRATLVDKIHEYTTELQEVERKLSKEGVTLL